MNYPIITSTIVDGYLVQNGANMSEAIAHIINPNDIILVFAYLYYNFGTNNKLPQ